MEFSKLVKADCSDHAVEIEVWDKDSIYLALWSPVGVRNCGRLKLAWYALRGQRYFDNDCVLSRPQASEVCQALMDAATTCHLMSMDAK